MVVAQPRIVRGAVDALAGDLEEAGVQLAHDADQSPHLVPGRQAAGDVTSVGCLGGRRPGGREPDRAGADGVAHLALHRLEIVLAGRLLERPLAHHVGAYGRVADVAPVVDALGQGVEAVEELGEGGPAPLDARLHGGGRDVLGALEIADDEVLVLLGAGGEREAAVTHHDRGDAVPAGRGTERIPEDLRVHVRVAVHEARCDHLALGVDHFAGALPDPADRDDAAVPHADVGPIPRQPGSIDHRSVLDHQVVGHSQILSRSLSSRGVSRPDYRWPWARSATWTLLLSRSKRSVFWLSTSPPVTRMKNVSSPYSIEWMSPTPNTAAWPASFMKSRWSSSSAWPGLLPSSRRRHRRIRVGFLKLP